MEMALSMQMLEPLSEVEKMSVDGGGPLPYAPWYVYLYSFPFGAAAATAYNVFATGFNNGYNSTR